MDIKAALALGAFALGLGLGLGLGLAGCGSSVAVKNVPPSTAGRRIDLNSG